MEAFAILVYLLVGVSIAYLSSTHSLRSNVSWDGMFAVIMIGWPAVLTLIPFVLTYKLAKKNFSESNPSDAVVRGGMEEAGVQSNS
jgi:hypothetical protein